MILWQTKENLSDQYVTMKTPSSFSIDGNDLDSKSYRSIVNGNLNRPGILGKKWQTAKFAFNFLTEEELETIINVLNYWPIYVKFKSPIFSTNGLFEGECYCAKWNVSMQQNKESGATWNSLTFDLVQSKKVAGQ